MAGYTYELAYQDVDELMARVGPHRFRRGERISVKISDHTDYVFTFVSESQGRINGRSALNGRMVFIDLQAMTLSEQA